VVTTGDQLLVTSAASGYVRPVDDAAESFVVGVVVALGDVPADHAGLLLWLAWSVPSSAKYRSAVNCASIGHYLPFSIRSTFEDANCRRPDAAADGVLTPL
jgi:hypothetical protein